MIHYGKKAFQLVFLSPCREHDALMIDVQVAGDFGGSGAFIVLRALQVVEAQGQGLQTRRRHFARESNQGGGV